LIIAAPAIGIGQTVAGFCNATLGSGANDLSGPWGIYVSPSDGSLYVTDYDKKRFQLFSPFSRTGSTLFSSGLIQPIDIFVDNSGTIYMIDQMNGNGAFVYIQRAGVIMSSFPAAGLSTTSCLFTGIYSAYGIAVDASGNMYISLYYCFMVVKWTPNATYGTLAAGKQGIQGSTGNTLASARFIHLDEARGALYVTDDGNNRIQKFIIGGNGTAVTVAGNLTSGPGLNQLKQPAGICVTRDGQTLYIADYGNNRVMKWVIGASQGSVVAGNASGVSGSTSQLLNGPGDVALGPSETYLYVSDYGNHRVQRFRLQ
jgi:DNA-binding beta-propeller fold protein YncE